MPRIFISYSRIDDNFCRRLIDFLQRELHLKADDIFFDQTSLRAGVDFLDATQREIVARPIFIVILSLESVKSEFVRVETTLALLNVIKDPKRRVIPIQIEPCQPERLAPLLTSRNIIDLSPGTPPAAWDELIRVIQGEPNVAPLTDPDLEKAVILAAQTHEAFIARQWQDVVRLGKLAVERPSNAYDHILWGDMGIALIRLGDLAEGLNRLKIALEISPYRGDLWRELGQALIAENPARLDEALDAWDHAYVWTADRKSRLDLLQARCSALQRAAEESDSAGARRRRQQILLAIKDAIKDAPDDAHWYIEEALTLQQLDQTEEALDVWRDLTRRSDAKPEWWLQRARLAVQLKHDGEAKDALAVIEPFAEHNEELAKEIAALHNEISFQDATQFHFPDSLANLGFTLMQSGDIEVIEPPLIAVPAGPFEMGSVELDDAQPVQMIVVEDFRISMFPVTVAEYACYIRATGTVPPAQWEQQLSRLEHPVSFVKWRDAGTYCSWLAERTGKSYRLATEVEWEKAARWDGTFSRAYPWGNEFDSSRCNTLESGLQGTTAVGRYPHGASYYGAQDMAGNVWEWCSSLIKGYPYRHDERESNTASGRRIQRGGAWRYDQDYAYGASRGRLDPSVAGDTEGFRIAIAGLT